MRKPLLLLSALTLASMNALASNDWYTIEVVTFTQGKHAAVDSENWPQSPALRHPATAIYTQEAAEVVDTLFCERYSNTITADTSEFDTKPTLQMGEDAPSEQVAHNDCIDETPAIADAAPISFDNSFDSFNSIELSPSTEHQLSGSLIIGQRIRQWVNDLDQQLSTANTDLDPLDNIPGAKNIGDNHPSRDELINAVTALSEYVKVSPTEDTLSVKNLQRKGYRILSRDLWRQYIPANSKGLPVVIIGGQKIGKHYELEGNITFDRTRYLHTGINLWFNTFSYTADGSNDTGPIIPALPARTLGETNETEADATLGAISKVYSLNTVERMRSGLTYYIDHPAFGVLVHVSKYSDRAELEKEILKLNELEEENL